VKDGQQIACPPDLEEGGGKRRRGRFNKEEVVAGDQGGRWGERRLWIE